MKLPFGAKAKRVFNSPCIEYANFNDGTYCNVIQLIKPYFNGVSFAVYSTVHSLCGLFKTEIRAKERFNKIKAKEFALSQIAPYYKNPETCGFNGDTCTYLTNDGRMCVAGKNLNEWALNKYKDEALLGINSIFEQNSEDDFDDYGGQELVFKEEVVGVLTNQEWQQLQILHDKIAKQQSINIAISELYLFTLEELEEYATNVSKK